MSVGGCNSFSSKYCYLNVEVTKVLNKLAKYAGCGSLLEWIKPCTNHLYWSTTTTLNCNVIVAKFKSFIGHVKTNTVDSLTACLTNVLMVLQFNHANG